MSEEHCPIHRNRVKNITTTYDHLIKRLAEIRNEQLQKKDASKRWILKDVEKDPLHKKGN